MTLIWREDHERAKVLATVPEEHRNRNVPPMKNRPTQHLEGCLRGGMRRLSDVQPGLAWTCKAILQNFLKAKLSVKAKLSSDDWDTFFRYLRNVEDKFRSMQFGGRVVLNRVRHTLRSTIKLLLSMVLIGSIPAVGAIEPGAAELGPLRAGDSDKVSTLAFGLVACVGVLITGLGFLMSIKWCRRQPRNSARSTPNGEILTRAAKQKRCRKKGKDPETKKEKVVVMVERS